LAVETFRAEYLTRRMLHLEGGSDRLGRLDLAFDRRAFRRAALEPGALVRAQYFNDDGVHRELSIRGDQIDDLIGAGMTICLTHAHAHDPPLAALAQAVRQESRYAGNVVVNAYLSPPSGGFGLHFDTQDVLTLQLEGEKMWRFGREPAVRHPRKNLLQHYPYTLREYRAEYRLPALGIPRDDELAEVTLRPGDLLYLPAGTWHKTVASRHSLSIAVTYMPFGVMDRVEELLRRFLGRDETWRAPTPPLGEAGAVEWLDERLTALGHLLLDKEARAQILDADLAPTIVPGSVEPDVELLVPAPLSARTTIDPDDMTEAVELSSALTGVLVGADARSLIDELVRRERFVAGDSLQWGGGRSWSEISEFLGGLLEAGLLRRA
jgi:hypothetical protein